MNDAIYNNPGFNLSYFHPYQDAELVKQLGFIPGLKEFVTIRQVHALEHATVWMLSDRAELDDTKLFNSYLSADNETIGGLSTEKGFYLYGEIDPLKLRNAIDRKSVV